ncbi:MAG: hypothetical protein GX354_10150 [Firmicutes bacterium]|jgi:D-serine deaminase-like pyridoxal phosphate-dependent protein|nr:hypothetical protein [Bacillota bacterium]
MHVYDLPTPALIVDRKRLKGNLERMAEVVAKAGVKLRPHIKTHKSPFIAHWQQELGARGVTIATVDEAEVMVYNGIKDIFMAYPVVERYRALRLARLSRLATVAVGVDSRAGASMLAEAAGKYNTKIGVLIEVDTGLKRSGLASIGEVMDLASTIGKLPNLELKGLFTHAGHAHGEDMEGRRTIGQREGEMTVVIADALRKAGFPIQEVSTGSTPSAAIVAKVPGVTEIRPGTYVFNDGSLVASGMVSWDQCALTVLATVVSKPTPQRCILDSGSKSLASDKQKNVPGFGSIKGLETITLSWLNEEHGVIESSSLDLGIGDKVEVIPNHACTVMNLFDEYYLVEDGLVLGRIPITARGHRHLV